MSVAPKKWQKLPRFLRWFYPGLRVKRWLGLLLAGLAAVSFGAALAIGLGPVLDLTDILSRAFGASHATQAAVVAGTVLAALGLAIVLLALGQLVRSVSEPLRGRDDRELVDVLLEHRGRPQGPSVVAIGGGTGLSNLLRGLKRHTSDIVAIVAVSDDGGSSGRLQREMNTLPPGDVRNCLVALADDEDLMARLLQYRFQQASSVEGHSLGNLFIAALTAITGDFERAVKETSKVLAIRGRVLPATLEHIAVCARLTDGTVVQGETDVSRTEGRIEQVYLVPASPAALPEAVGAILEADLVIIGPGSTYTSVVPNLLVPGIVDALRATSAIRVLVCNVMTQPGETDRLVRASDQVRTLTAHAGGKVFDYVLINEAVPSPEVLRRYDRAGASIVQPDAEEVGRLGLIPICGDLISQDDYARHDPEKLAQATVRLAPVPEPVI